jgi:uncharacterized protein YdgA (DUF945 family)
MKKLAISLAVVVVLAAAAAAAVPWYVGMETEKYFQSQLNETLLGANASVTVKMVQYDRGWLGATAVQRVALKTDPSVQFDIHHEIDHLPDPGAGWLKVRSTPRWPKEVQAGADYYFGNQPALTLDSTLDFDGHLTTTVTSPAFSKPMLKSPDTTVSWGGASGTLAFAKGGKMHVKLQAPSVGVSSAAMNLQVANSTVEANWVLQGAEIDWHGDSSLDIAKISVASPVGKGSLSGLKAVVSQRDKGETIQVGYTLKVGKGEATGASQSVMAFSNAVLDLEIDQLDKQAIAKYMQDLHNAQAAKVGQEAMNRLALQLGMSLMTDLLKGSPVLRVKQIGVETGAGAIAGNATISFDGKELGQPTVPAEWLQRVSFKGSGEISRGLLKSMMSPKMQAQAALMLAQNGGTADPAQIQQLVDRALEDQFKAWGAAGLVQDNGDKLTVKAELSQGKLLVNGQPGDHLMPPMMMMAPPQPTPAALRPPEEEA